MWHFLRTTKFKENMVVRVVGWVSKTWGTTGRSTFSLVSSNHNDNCSQTLDKKFDVNEVMLRCFYVFVMVMARWCPAGTGIRSVVLLQNRQLQTIHLFWENQLSLSSYVCVKLVLSKELTVPSVSFHSVYGKRSMIVYQPLYPRQNTGAHHIGKSGVGRCCTFITHAHVVLETTDWSVFRYFKGPPSFRVSAVLSRAANSVYPGTSPDHFVSASPRFKQHQPSRWIIDACILYFGEF